MTTARSQLICPDITPYYHCVSRCVRRSFLCGEDPLTGVSYSHRREWVEQRLLSLATIYCIQICAYAVMSNHYHLVVYIDKQSALALSEQQVIERWSIAHHLPAIIQRFQHGQVTTKAEIETCYEIIEIWRTRLYSLSWFMRELNQHIATHANREDHCTGRFWEGRFKSQALLDEKALLAAMAYVDLNPVRANAAPTPEQSDYTSIKIRLENLKQDLLSHQPLLDFIDDNNSNSSNSGRAVIPFRLTDYLKLLDWLGRQIREGKSGHIAHNTPPILTRLSLPPKECIALCTVLEIRSRLWIGTRDNLNTAKVQLNRQRITGIVIS
ncbi:transposase [Vibrio sp. ABG19]|uniref:transposase n=1 Tax=Vibrio sp. ABG19 TaxID=2817385 RepID=UPI00249F5664|nr:transposase [Vibrio sp. ABG19]WGY47473.1 transposase [Vibrio sp. ABG19]